MYTWISGRGHAYCQRTQYNPQRDCGALRVKQSIYSLTCSVTALPSTSMGFRLKSVPTVALVSALNSLLQNWFTRHVFPVLGDSETTELRQ